MLLAVKDRSSVENLPQLLGVLRQGLNDPVGDQKPTGHKKICQGHYTARESRVVMQPCKTLGSKLEINSSVFPLPSSFCLKPNIMQTAAAFPLLRPLQHQNLSVSKNSCQHLKICLASTWKQRRNCLRYHLISPGALRPAKSRTQQNRIPSPPATQASRVNCSTQEVMQTSPTWSSFLFSS